MRDGEECNTYRMSNQLPIPCLAEAGQDSSGRERQWCWPVSHICGLCQTLPPPPP